MADIKELGESLLARAKQSNKDRYKRSRNDAYRVAALTAGVSFMNEAVKQNAVNFMTSEQAMAQKAKYRAAVNRADGISKTHQAIQESGKTPEQYFYEAKYLPMMEEQFKASFGNDYVPEEYKPQLMDKALELAKADAADFENAYNVAASLPDMETAMTEYNSLIMPPTNIGAAAYEKIKGFFTGKKESDFRAEAIQRANQNGILNDPTIKETFDRVSRNEGLGKALQFVKGIDTSGMKKIETVEYKYDIVSSQNGEEFSLFKTRITKDADGSVIDTKVERERFAGVGEDSEAGKAALARAVIEGAKPWDIARLGLNANGLAYLNEDLFKRGLNLVDIRTLNELEEIGGVITEYLSIPEYIKDDVAKQAASQALSAIVSGSQKLIESNIQDAKNEGRDIAEEYSKNLDAMVKAVNMSFGISSLPERSAGIETRTPRRNDGVVDWNSPLPSEQ